MQDDNIAIESQMILPYSFSVFLGTNESPPLQLTVLNTLNLLLIDKFHPDSFHSRKTIVIDREVMNLLPSSQKNFRVKLEGSEDKQRFGVLMNCGAFENAFEFVELLQEEALDLEIEDLKSLAQFPKIGDSFEGSLPLWRVEPKISFDEPKKLLLDSFSMKPPLSGVSLLPSVLKSAPALDISPQSERNPLNFLFSRYFNTLYSLTTPLTYFPKTSLSRFRNMCGNDHAVMKANLTSVFLTPEQLDDRHKNRYGLDKLVTGETTAAVSVAEQYELENQKIFVSKHFSEKPKEELQGKLILELKIREAELQILVLMELLLSCEIDETKFLTENLNKQNKEYSKKRKLTLVRRKNRQKKVIPTFLGVGIHEKDVLPVSAKQLDEYTMYMSLITLVDQMSIWDTLLGRVKGEKDDSMYGFLAYVLVPYFNKQLPQTVKFVITKVKELRPKLKVPRGRRSNSKEEGGPVEESVSVDEISAPSEALLEPTEKPRRSSKFAKTLLAEDQRPFLRRAVTSGPKELEPAFILKRSKSNLGSKNLKRRQVDISVSKPGEPENKRAKLFLFGDARKFKSTIPVVRQVGATPAKKSNSAGIITHVLATPSANRRLELLQRILETPQQSNGFVIPGTGTRKLTLQEKFALLGPPTNAEMRITSSPVMENTHIQHHHFDIQSSPEAGVTSSPIFNPKKPEDPVLPTKDSPFFNSTLNGSPTFKSSEAFGGSIFGKAKLHKKKVQPKLVKLAEPFIRAPPSVARKEPDVTECDFPMARAATVDLGFLAETKELSLPPAFKGQLTDARSSLSSDVDILGSTTSAQGDTDTDSDSDYERLLANISKPPVRTYSKQR